MSADSLWPWVPLAVLGAAHGVNPGMGWLFAVALGLQARDRGAIWRALVPLALGHCAAIAVALAVAVILGDIVPARVLSWIIASTLVSLGLRQLVRHRHRVWRGAGMRVGFRDLAVWSFLMATAHGAGLMAVPFVPGKSEGTHRHHGAVAVRPGDPGTPPPLMAVPSAVATTLADRAAPDRTDSVLATVAHTLGYLLVTALVALVVYEGLGVQILRSAWINLDVIWALALIVTGVVAAA